MHTQPLRKEYVAVVVGTLLCGHGLLQHLTAKHQPTPHASLPHTQAITLSQCASAHHQDPHCICRLDRVAAADRGSPDLESEAFAKHK